MEEYNFIDKKYNDVYCTVEVFRDNLNAVRRQASIDALYYLYDALEIGSDGDKHAAGRCESFRFAPARILSINTPSAPQTPA